MEDTTQGTTTDAAGHYELPLAASPSYRLRFTYVRFETQTHTVTLPATHGLHLHTTLQSAHQALQQVEVLSRRETTHCTKPTFTSLPGPGQRLP